MRLAIVMLADGERRVGLMENKDILLLDLTQVDNCRTLSDILHAPDPLGLARFLVDPNAAPIAADSVRLLAPELARKQITINAICPGFVPVGINQQVNSRQQKLELARVPLGRLCQPADVVQAVRYLLSPAASFVSGQMLGLTGGQL